MNPQEFMKIIESGSRRELSDLSYDLLHITEMSVLKELSTLVNHAEDRAKTLPESEKAEAESLHRICSFLKPISTGSCRCIKYSISGYPAHSEQTKGLVKILSETSDNVTFESRYSCQCVLCRKRFKVFEFEAGFGRRSEWKKN